MRRVLALVAVVAVSMPAAAQAKGGDIVRLKVCGASGCRTISDPYELGPLIGGLAGHEPRKAPPPSAFFTLRPDRIAGWPPGWPRYVYVPAAQLVRQDGPRLDPDWWPLIWTDGAYERATRGMTPFPKPVSWARLHTPAPDAKPATGRSRGPLAAAIGAAVLVAVCASILRRRRRVRPD